MTLRKGLNQDLETLDDGFSICTHGSNNTLKTYLGGSMLQWLLKQGKRVVFLNISGENGYRTLANFPLIEPSKHLWDAETYQDIEQAQEDLEKDPVDGLVVDSGKIFAEKVALKITKGVNRPLVVSNQQGVSNTDWPDMNFYLPQMVQRLRRCAKYVMITCTSKVAADPLDASGRWFEKKSRQIRPAFPGQSSGFSVGWFDFLAYCEVDADLGKIDRFLHLEYSDDFSTRARVVTQFTKPIKVLEGPDCWEAVYKEMEKHCIRKGAEEKPVDNKLLTRITKL